MEEKIASKRLVVPWGSKIHIGIEVVFMKPAEDVSEDGDFKSKDLNSTNSHFQLPRKITNDKLSLIMQSTCLLNSPETSFSENIILQRHTLFEKQNFRVRKLAKGETFTIQHPWIKSTTVSSHNCLPDITEFELCLVWKRSYGTIFPPNDTFPLAINVEAPENENSHSLLNTVNIRFRFNYISV